MARWHGESEFAVCYECLRPLIGILSNYTRLWCCECVKIKRISDEENRSAGIPFIVKNGCND